MYSCFCISLSLSIYLCLFRSLTMYLSSLSKCVHLCSFFLSVSMSISLFLSVSTSLSICLSESVPFFLSKSINIFFFLSIYLCLLRLNMFFIVFRGIDVRSILSHDFGEKKSNQSDDLCEMRGQFHQDFTLGFLVRKFFAKVFCA